MPFLIITAAAVAVAAAVMLVYYLIRAVVVLRSISAKLANARILLLTVADQTEPAGELVGGVGSNVNDLHELVTGVARSLSLSVPGVR